MADIRPLRASGEDIWTGVKSSLSACIASLIHVGWGSIHPATRKTEDGQWQAKLDHSEITRKMVIKEMTTTAANEMWANLSPHIANAGLQHGLPELKTPKRCHKTVGAKGHVKTACL